MEFGCHEDRVSAVVVTQDGKRAISGSVDIVLHVWEDADEKWDSVKLKGRKHRVSVVAMTPDGNHIVSGSYHRTICVCRETDGSWENVTLNGHEEWVSAAAVTPDGGLLFPCPMIELYVNGRKQMVDGRMQYSVIMMVGLVQWRSRRKGNAIFSGFEDKNVYG